MLGEPRLNVYVLNADVSPRLLERMQAQVQTAIRALPTWTFSLLASRMTELGVTGLALIIDPAKADDGALPLSFGDIEGQPAALLRPRVSGNRIEWGQEIPYVVAKAVGYLAAPPPDAPFWIRWAAAVESDGLRAMAAQSSASWRDETDLGLLIEMFAAYALRNGDNRWSRLRAVQSFLREWRGDLG